MARILVTVLTLLAFTGCTTLQPLADAQPTTIRQAIQPGDNVEIERVDGTRLKLTVESVTDEMLQGTDDDKRYELPLASIRTIGVRSMTTSDKVWTGVGVAAALGVAIAVAGGGSGGGGDRGGPGY